MQCHTSQGKERESVQAAQSLVLLEGKLEQLASKLQLTQQRSDLQSEAFHEERKRLHRQVGEWVDGSVGGSVGGWVGLAGRS